MTAGRTPCRHCLMLYSSHMESETKNLQFKKKFFMVFIGAVLGFALGVLVMNALIPNASKLVRMYRLDYKSIQEDSRAANKMGGGTMETTAIVSEKQFVEDMVSHHEAAVTMAQEMLALNPRDEVRKVANDIIRTQSGEIEMMKGWLKDWDWK